MATVPVEETRVVMSKVLPRGSFGFGVALKEMDLASCASAESFAKANAVTVGIDEFATNEEGRTQLMSSKSEHSLVIVCTATVNAAWRSSMEVGCKAFIELADGSRITLCSAYFTFCLLVRGSPLPTLEIGDQEIDQQRRYTEAQERRKIRLARKSFLESFSAPRLERSDSRTVQFERTSSKSSPRDNRILAGEFETLHLVLPQHGNHMGNLFGGNLLDWSLQSALIASHRTCKMPCRLIASDEIFFFKPVHVGDRVVVRARCNRVFHGNLMEIGIKVICKSCDGVTRNEHALSAYFLISPDLPDSSSISIGQIDPITDDDKRRYKKAKSRQALRLQRLALKSARGSVQPLLNPSNMVETSKLILENVAGLLRAFKTSLYSPKQWETIVNEGDVSVQVFHPSEVSTASPSVIVLSIDMPLKMSAEMALRHCMEPELRRKWDLLFRDNRVLHKLTDHDDVIIQTAGAGDNLIDFVLLRSWRTDVQGAPGRLLMSSISVEFDQAPKQEDRRRGQVLSSGFIIDPRGEKSCQARYLVQMTNAGLQLLIGDVIGKSSVYASALRFKDLQCE